MGTNRKNYHDDSKKTAHADRSFQSPSKLPSHLYYRSMQFTVPLLRTIYAKTGEAGKAVALFRDEAAGAYRHFYRHYQG